MNVREAYKKIENAMEQIQTNEEWKRFLSFSSRFHSYSFGNTILIWDQKPFASYVAGYIFWKKLNRYVKRNEKGIYVFAPMKYKIPKEDSDEEIYTVRGFKLVSVFDISQTEGDDSKLPVLVTGLKSGSNNHETIYQMLCSIINLPISEDDSIAAKGEYHHSDDPPHIVIKKSISPTQKIKTLLHEYSHHLSRNYPETNHADEEIIAEAAAFIACSFLNIDTSDYSFPYIASWSEQDKSRLRSVTSKAISISNDIIAEINASPVFKELLTPPEPSLV